MLAETAEARQKQLRAVRASLGVNVGGNLSRYAVYPLPVLKHYFLVNTVHSASYANMGRTISTSRDCTNVLFIDIHDAMKAFVATYTM